MAVLGMVRLSHAEIKQIIAEHMASKYGGSAEVIEIWPDRDQYRNEMFATVAVRSPESIPLGYYSSKDETGSV